MEINIALAQNKIVPGQLAQNESRARRVAAQASERGIELLILPELWPSGYDLDQARIHAAPLDEGPFALMAELALTHQIHITGTALEANPNGLPYNTAALFGPQGERIGAYRKIHLFAPLGEVEHMSPGQSLPTFDLPWGRTALAICYDLRFPELWRHYTDAGVQLILIPAEWPQVRVEHWQLLLRARAVENQIFVAGCNRAGRDSDGDYGGHSAVIDPWGRVLVEGGTEPGLLFATLNLREVSRSRRRLPALADRRPEVYG
jgi:predicted amidohydrolase